MMDLSGKRVFVTGASSGIGRQIAKSFAQAGCAVAVSARSQDKLNSLCEEINVSGGKAAAYAANALDGKALAHSVDKAAADMGGIDVVVHCTGMTIKGPLQDMSPEDWDTVLDSNLKSTYYMARLTYRYLKESAATGNAKFIAIGSVGTFFAVPLSAAYCASKGGVVQLVRTETPCVPRPSRGRQAYTAFPAISAIS
jgi:2-deoxy-D-gluconate 3-dehydrogenase